MVEELSTYFFGSYQNPFPWNLRSTLKIPWETSSPVYNYGDSYESDDDQGKSRSGKFYSLTEWVNQKIAENPRFFSDFKPIQSLLQSLGLSYIQQFASIFLMHNFIPNSR